MATRTTEQKCVMVIDDSIPLGLIANTAAVLALTLGRKIESIGIGPDTYDATDGKHQGITTVPIPILKSDKDRIKEIRERAVLEDALFVVDFTNAAQGTTTYRQYTLNMRSMNPERLTYLGIALFGGKKAVNTLTGNLPLLR